MQHEKTSSPWLNYCSCCSALSIVSGLANPESALISGPIIILGALAYRSAKRRKLDEVKSTSLRKILEIAAIVLILASVGLQNNLKHEIATDPVPNLIIPLWAIIAYLIIISKKPRN